jgi:hypothetical protein
MLCTPERLPAFQIEIYFLPYQPIQKVDGQALSCDGALQSSTIWHAGSKQIDRS